MFDFVVSQVEGEHLIVREEKFSDHHGSISLDFVSIKVEHLQVSAILQGLSEVLGTIRLDLVTL